ncbi:putative lipid II flippase FtsW [bacterium]|nr:MAG: putative lipid II flippase FtsW [bacterium]
MPKTKSKLNLPVLLLTAALVVIGLSMLWSASTAESTQNFGNTTYYLVHQLTRGVLIGAISLYFFSRFDYNKLKKPAGIFLAVALVLLVLVKMPGLGVTANGATRWISLGPIFFQPAELAKLAVIIYLAAWMSKPDRAPSNNFWHSVFPPLVLIVVMSMLIIWQPDLGSTLSLLAISMTMFFAGGVRLKYLAGLAVSGVVAVLGIAWIEPYRLQRITAFLNPSGDPLGIGYQINQALIAVGSGGLFGYGYGLSRQKHFYLPETINDSIFAIIAEELGFIRIVLILLIFGALLYKMMQVALKASDNFGRMLAIGITSLIAINVTINIAAIIGLVPLTGIPLPFFSYGSTAMIVNLTAIGILLNISKQSKA